MVKTLGKFQLFDPDALQRYISDVKFLEIDDRKKLNSLLERYILLQGAAPSSSFSTTKKMRL